MLKCIQAGPPQSPEERSVLGNKLQWDEESTHWQLLLKLQRTCLMVATMRAINMMLEVSGG